MLINLERNLVSLNIKGLFGNEDVNIPFNSTIKILMGENGTGKTTILNILYYTLTLNYAKLTDLPFFSVTLGFSSGNKLTIIRSDLEEKILAGVDNEFSDYLHSKFSKQEISELIRTSKKGRRELDMLLINKNSGIKIPKSLLYQELSKGSSFQDDNNEDILKREIKEEILYFPTYRRIEEDLSKLGFSEIDIEDQLLIKFGLTDVEKRIEDLIQTINELSIKWFSKVNGEMLTQLINGISVTDEMKESLKNQVH